MVCLHFLNLGQAILLADVVAVRRKDELGALQCEDAAPFEVAATPAARADRRVNSRREMGFI